MLKEIRTLQLEEILMSMDAINKKTIVDGIANIVAGRDINISLKELSDIFEPYLINLIDSKIKEVDNKVNNLFPELVESARTKDNNTRFSSKLMISSLGLIGVPIDAAILILDSIVPEFELISANSKVLSALQIRECVANALLKFDSKFYTNKKVQVWADRYIRRYGNPERRIQVLYNDGNLKILDIEFLRNNLIPHLVSTILSQTRYEDFKKWVTESEVRAMAREILDMVSSLNIYRIHYETLLLLSKEMALQPPHPWLVQKAFDFEAVYYNYDRAMHHFNNITKKYTDVETPLLLYSARECLHHSCSAILSYYGICIGCGDNSAIHNLDLILKNMYSRKKELINHYSRVDVFYCDLKKYDIEIIDIINCIVRIKLNINVNNISSPDIIKDHTKHIEVIVLLMKQLLENYVQVNLLRNVNIEVLQKVDFINVAQNAISIFPNIEIVSKNKNHFWVKHVFSKYFGDLISEKSLVLITCNSQKNHNKEIELAKRYLKERQGISNSFIILSNRHISQTDKLQLISLQKERIYGAITNLEHVINVITNDNPEKYIEALLKNKIHLTKPVGK